VVADEVLPPRRAAPADNPAIAELTNKLLALMDPGHTTDSVADGFYLGGYPILAVGLLVIDDLRAVRIRS
jgi:hypothetical protein